MQLLKSAIKPVIFSNIFVNQIKEDVKETKVDSEPIEKETIIEKISKVFKGKK